jgi:hypothetical protein
MGLSALNVGIIHSIKIIHSMLEYELQQKQKDILMDIPVQIVEL